MVPLYTTGLVAALLGATNVIAQIVITAPVDVTPFFLQLRSSNATLNNRYLFACNVGPANETLCLGSEQSSRSAAMFTWQSLLSPNTGLLARDMELGGRLVPSLMTFFFCPCETDVGLSWFVPTTPAPGGNSAASIGFHNNSMFAAADFRYDPEVPSPDSSIELQRSHFFMCRVLTDNYDHTALYWSTSDTAPRNRICQSVDVSRVYPADWDATQTALAQPTWGQLDTAGTQAKQPQREQPQAERPQREQPNTPQQQDQQNQQNQSDKPQINQPQGEKDPHREQPQVQQNQAGQPQKDQPQGEQTPSEESQRGRPQNEQPRIEQPQNGQQQNDQPQRPEPPIDRLLMNTFLQAIADQLNIPTMEKPFLAPLNNSETNSSAGPVDEPALAAVAEVGATAEVKEEVGQKEDGSGDAADGAAGFGGEQR